MDESGELFSDEALARVVSSQHQSRCGRHPRAVIRDVRAFVGQCGAPRRHDDDRA